MRRAVSALILLAAPALALRQDQSDRNGHGVRTGPSHCAARNGTVGLTKRVASTYPRRPDSEDHVPIPLRKQWHQAARCLPDTDVLGSMRFSRCAVVGGARREKPQPVRRYDLVMRVGPNSRTHSHLGALMNVQWLSDVILGYERGRRLQARAARGLSAPVQSRARLRAAGSAIRQRRPRVTRRPPRKAHYNVYVAGSVHENIRRVCLEPRVYVTGARRMPLPRPRPMPPSAPLARGRCVT